jgi:AsmA-like C-terminal region
MTKRRMIAWLAGGFVFFIVLIGLLLPRVLNSEAVKENIQTVLADKLGQAVRFETIDFTWLPWPAASVRGVGFSVADDVKGTVENLELYPSIRGLLRGRLHASQINAQRLAIVAQIERTEEPLDIGKLEEKLRTAMRNFISNFPRLQLRIDDGSAEVQIGDRRPLVFSEIEGWISGAASNLEFSLSAQADVSGGIRFSGKITEAKLATEARFAVEQLRLREFCATFLPVGLDYIENGTVDLDLQLSALGLSSFKAEVRGAMPSLTLVHESGKAIVQGKNFTGTVIGDERMIRAGMKHFELISPRLDIAGEVQLDRTTSAATLTLEAKNGDAETLRELALRVAGTSAPVQEVFRYVHGGQIAEVRIETKGRSLGQAPALRDMIVGARIRDGKIFIPALELALEDVDGSLAIADGILESKNFTARHGNARVRDGKLRLGLDPKTAVPFHLDILVESGAEEAHDLLRRAITDKTYLKESSKIRNLNGELAGRLILDGPFGSLVPKILISKANLKAVYEPVPLPITVSGGRFNYADRMIRIESLDATLGRSSISKLSGSLKTDENRGFLVEAAGLSFDVEEIHGWLRRFADRAPQFDGVKSARGKVELASFSLSGSLNDPSKWQFRGKGRVDGLVVNHSDLSSPVTLTQGNFDATVARFTFSDVKAELLDASVAVGGLLENPLKGRRSVDAVASGVIGPKVIQWLRRTGELSEKLTPRSPLQFTEAHVRWSDDGNIAMQGKFTVADGPKVYLNAVRDRQSISVREFVVEHGMQRARMTFEAAKDRIELSFAGELEQKTLRQIFLMPPLQSGFVHGDLKASYFLKPPFRFSALGKLEGKNLQLPLHDGPVAVDSFVVAAEKQKMMLRSAGVQWRGSRFALSGHAAAVKDGLDIDMDVAADRLAWKDIDDLTQRSGRSAAIEKLERVEHSAFMPNERVRVPPLRGVVRLKAEEFVFEDFSSKPLHIDLAFSSRELIGQVKRSIVCGINASGKFDVKNETIGLDMRLSVTDGELASTSRCLTQGEAEGTYSLKADLKGVGDRKALLQSLKGNVAFAAHDGRFIRAPGVDAAFDYLNETGDFNVAFPDLDRESFPYRLLSIKGTLDGPIFTADEVVVRSTSLTITGGGKVDLERKQIDGKGLVSVAAPGSRVLRNVPILGSVLGGSLVGIPLRVNGALERPNVSYLSAKDVGAELLNVPLRILGLPLEALQIFTPGSDEPK